MKRPTFRRCGTAPGALSPEDQAVVDQFRAMLAAVRNPQPWTPGDSQERVGPFVERAHTRPGDDHAPEMSCPLHAAAALITDNAGLQTYYAALALDPQGEAE
ncbi:hypothetical protein [Streptomyces sp. NPDC006552]|uniref:hypothetical protein n=1 Tax=Streptomyces sp. NPDC006552 TaxID=3157179 RepID=UPI0033A93C52